MSFICSYCSIEKFSLKSLRSHEGLCKHNPNRRKSTIATAKQAAEKAYEICHFCNIKIQKCSFSRHVASCGCNPNIGQDVCQYCQRPIGKRKKFCSKSCSAKHSNKVKPRYKTEEEKQKISNGVKTHLRNHPTRSSFQLCISKASNLGIDHETMWGPFCTIFVSVCKICETRFVCGCKTKHRATCSKKCKTELTFKNRTYVNGKRKNIQHYCKTSKTQVMLESSWEHTLANMLDFLDVKWIRPDPLEWIDMNNTTHLYYPDFYLLDYATYLDPKNPFAMVQDQEKMKIISKNHFVVYGDLYVVMDFISSLAT